MESSAYEIRLSNHDERLAANHDSIRELRGTSARHETEIKVSLTEQRETREDVADLKKSFEEERKERREDSEKTRKAFYSAAVTLGTLSLTVIGLIIVLLQHG